MQPTYIYVQHFMLTDDFGLFKKQDLGARLPTNYLNHTKIEVIYNRIWLESSVELNTCHHLYGSNAIKPNL